MNPRIRSFAPVTPLTVRQAPAIEAPRVFREFVETLQKLDAAPKTRARSNGARKRAANGNGQARSRAKRSKS